MTTSNFQMS